MGDVLTPDQVPVAAAFMGPVWNATLCDPMWTSLNGGICTDGDGNFRRADGSVVTDTQLHSYLASTDAQAKIAANQGQVNANKPGPTAAASSPAILQVGGFSLTGVGLAIAAGVLLLMVVKK